jgi:hypothetical protein
MAPPAGLARLFAGPSKVVDGRLKGGGVSLVMQSLISSPMAYEAEEYPAMNESTTDIRIVPLPQGQDVLTDILRSTTSGLGSECRRLGSGERSGSSKSCASTKESDCEADSGVATITLCSPAGARVSIFFRWTRSSVFACRC